MIGGAVQPMWDGLGLRQSVSAGNILLHMTSHYFRRAKANNRCSKHAAKGEVGYTEVQYSNRFDIKSQRLLL